MPTPQPSYGPVTDNTKPVMGGDMKLLNGNEAHVLARCVEYTEGVYSPLGEDDSHVQPVYRNRGLEY